MIKAPEVYRVLVVDDEPDIHTLTKLTLRTMKYGNIPIKITKALSGAEALEEMKAHPETAVVLLDVVMETQSAGLDTCRAIREELKNNFTRIILRTGQPGIAPERQVIEEYDIDGYLPKEDLTTSKLYTSVRTAIKAYSELIQLERHSEALTIINDLSISLHSFDPLEVSLKQILDAVLKMAPSPFAILNLETFEHEGEPLNFLLHTSLDNDSETTKILAEKIILKVHENPSEKSLQEGRAFETGFIIPIKLHRALGYGWLYIENNITDPLILKLLPILASHASNALYSSIAQKMLAERDENSFDSITI